MSSPIPALTALRPIDLAQPFLGGREPQLGELLKLRVLRAGDGSLLGAGAGGLLLPLAGLQGEVEPGEWLLLRVLSVRPRLELQLAERQAAAGTAAEAALAPDSGQDSPALRTEQAWLAHQRLVSAGPPPPAAPVQLALQWRAQVFSELQYARAEDPGAYLPGGAPLPQESLPPAVYQLAGWQNQGLLLRLLLPLPGQLPWQPVERDGHHPGSGEEVLDDGSPLLLCISLEFNGDWVQVLLHWDHGLQLHFAADQAATLERVRALLPGIASAIAAVPLRLRSCLLSVRSPELVAPAPERVVAGLTGSNSSALFRAAAELVKVLQLSQPSEPITAISR